ncbi:MAG: two-component regulator propeller domain-containing protein [Verrucomicrobiota bacterium]
MADSALDETGSHFAASLIKGLYRKSTRREELSVPKKRPSLLQLFTIGCWTLLNIGLPAASVPPRFTVEVWQAQEGGLPQNSVIDMVQTQDGYLWLSTLNGLARFDGVRFTVFDESNTPGLRSSRIVKLFEDSKRNIWLGTETSGAALIKNGKVVSLDLGRGRREGMLRSVCEDALGGVWLFTQDGELARYYNEKVDVWNVGRGEAHSVIAEKSGVIWVGLDQALFSLDPKAIRSSTPLSEVETVAVGKLDFLLASRTGGHWRLMDGTVQKWVSGRLEKKWLYPWRAGTLGITACEDADGNLVVGTLAEGIFWFDNEGNVTRITEKEGLSYNSVLSLYADKEGSLWVGLDGGGLNRVKRQIFKVLNESVGLTVRSVTEDSQGGLWFSSDHQIDYLKRDILEHFPMNRFYVRPLLVDTTEKIWAGTYVGMFAFDKNLFRGVAGAPSRAWQVSALHQDRSGQLWVGTQAGLLRWRESEPEIYTTKDKLSSNLIRAIADDAEGNLWIGTERGGLNKFRDGKFASFQQTNGFPSDNISSLYVDGDGVLWVGTFSSGLVRFQNGKWTHYTTSEGLISNGIAFIVDDGLGCLWIGSNTGLMRVPKKALNDFARGGADFIPCRGFGKRDGLPASECTFGSQPAACRTRDGNLWIPTIAGLASVNPAEVRPNPNPPAVMIESVLVEGQEQNTNGIHGKILEAVIVPAGKEHLDIQYTSLNLTAPLRARFKYRLQPHEKDWIPVGDRRIAQYPKLPPGEYLFQVTACNEDGVWNETGSSLAVSVLPPFWRKWWFIAAVALGLLGLIVAVVHFVSTQKLQRQLEGLRQQQALEKERARIARDIHDQVGASLTQVSLLGEMVESDKNLPEEVEAHARQISQTARETSHALDEIVWTVNPSNDTVDGLINYVCKHAQEYLAVAGLRYRLEVPDALPHSPISPETRHNVFLASKEAVTNVVKHAQATEVWLRLRLGPSAFVLEIEDNGRGPAGMTGKSSRNGLSNMRKRMEDIGGRFSIGPRPEGGTIVSLTVPIGNS